MKNKTVFLSMLNVRAEAVDGSAIPDDELQCDFIISTGDVDGHCSVMSESSLRNYAQDAAKGVPFMLCHENDMDKQIGRTISARFEEDSQRTIATVSLLRDTSETPEHMKVGEYIRRIERGMYNSVSVGFRGAREICNLDGKEIFDYFADDPCPHIPGRVYDGQRCIYTVEDARLREVSLVPAGSNPNAKLLDVREWPEELQRIKQDGQSDVKADKKPASLLERDGLRYRESVIDKAIQAGVRADDNFDENVWRKRFETMDAEFIQEQTQTWDALGDARWGTGGRKTSGSTQSRPDDALHNFDPDVLKMIYQ